MTVQCTDYQTLFQWKFRGACATIYQSGLLLVEGYKLLTTQHSIKIYFLKKIKEQERR